MNYAEKLNKFNNNKKYWSEVHFLKGLVQAGPIDRVLDYGCGTGYCAKIMRMAGIMIHGTDKNHHDKSFKYAEPVGIYASIYLMHSIAHMISPLEELISLKSFMNENSQIIVITPNADWIEMIPPSPNYHADPTVVQHFSQYSLERLFKDAELTTTQIGQFGERRGCYNERLFITGKL